MCLVTISRSYPAQLDRSTFNIQGGAQNTIYWSVVSTTGGAYATFTDTFRKRSVCRRRIAYRPSQHRESAGTCSISGTMGSLQVTSTATVTVQAQSVDNTNVAAKFLFTFARRRRQSLWLRLPAGFSRSEDDAAIVGNGRHRRDWDMEHLRQPGRRRWNPGRYRQPGHGLLSHGDGPLTWNTRRIPTDQERDGISTSHRTPCLRTQLRPNGTQPHECYVDPGLTGGDYEVGSARLYNIQQHARDHRVPLAHHAHLEYGHNRPQPKHLP